MWFVALHRPVIARLIQINRLREDLNNLKGRMMEKTTNPHGQPRPRVEHKVNGQGPRQLPPPRPVAGDNRPVWDVLQSVHRRQMVIYEEMRLLQAEMEVLARKLSIARETLFGTPLPTVMPNTPDEPRDENVQEIAEKFAGRVGR